jgi:outer membrane biosynthesis protein TonB
MDTRSGFFPTLMLASLLLVSGSPRPTQSVQSAPPQPAPPTTLDEPAQKPTSPDVYRGMGNGVDILSDTQGVDFAPYIREMLKLLQKNWKAIMPEETKTGEKGKVTITLEIFPDGSLGTGDPQLEKSSEVKVLDKAAMNAIHDSVPFESLPQQFHGPFLKLRILFLYNIKPSAGDFKPVAGKD